MASLAIISDTTRATPKRRTSWRNGRSDTPDIGARITGAEPEPKSVVRMALLIEQPSSEGEPRIPQPKRTNFVQKIPMH